MEIGKDKLKEIIKLENKKYRNINSKYLIYSKHIVDEALKNNKLELVLTDKDDLSNEFKEKILTYKITTAQMNKFKGVKNTNIIGLCSFDNLELKGKKILGLNKVSDPGNLGTILRTAKAFGIEDIILDEDCVDLYNPKTIAAMQGVNYSLNIIKKDLFSFCQETNLKIITSFLDEKNQIDDLKGSRIEEFIIILGNEAKGIEEKFKELKHTNFKIDIKYESLNVAIASGIIIYEITKEK